MCKFVAVVLKFTRFCIYFRMLCIFFSPFILYSFIHLFSHFSVPCFFCLTCSLFYFFPPDANCCCCHLAGSCCFFFLSRFFCCLCWFNQNWGLSIADFIVTMYNNHCPLDGWFFWFCLSEKFVVSKCWP